MVGWRTSKCLTRSGSSERAFTVSYRPTPMLASWPPPSPLRSRPTYGRSDQSPVTAAGSHRRRRPSTRYRTRWQFGIATECSYPGNETVQITGPSIPLVGANEVGGPCPRPRRRRPRALLRRPQPRPRPHHHPHHRRRPHPSRRRPPNRLGYRTISRLGHRHHGASRPRTEPARASRLPDRQDDPRRRLTALNEDHYALYAGTGRWSATAAGAAARELNDARDRLVEARHAAEDPTARRRDRRAAVKVLPNVEHSVAPPSKRGSSWARRRPRAFKSRSMPRSVNWPACSS